MTDRQSLRRTLRARRRALTPQQQLAAARILCRRLQHQPLFRRSRHIAFYLPNDGELDPRPLMQLAWKMNKHCYLPVLQPFHQRLYFIRHNATAALRSNRFGIPEPVLRLHTLKAPLLDLVLLPLVGFDAHGGRIGMGGGFYDRSFAFKKLSKSAKPFMLGLAHSCQQVDKLDCAAWDIPLDAIVTEKKIFITHRRAAQQDFLTTGR